MIKTNRRRTAPARTLVVMVKVPQAGRVKTRLARGIGVVGAVQFYRHTTQAVLGRVVSSREWQTVLAVAPDTGRINRAFPGHITRVCQGSGDLGARMQRVMDHMPPGPVLIIGSDIPGIKAAHIRRGFAALGRFDAVFGPAPDGGYWMAGLKRIPRVPRAFQNVRWSSEHALSDTRANMKGLRVALIDNLQDVDTAEDLAAMAGRCGKRI